MTATVLIVVDVQTDFCPGGSLAVPDGDGIVPVVNALMRRHARRQSPVVLTQDWHPAGHISFASSHPGRAPFESIDLPYGRQVLWPDHCIQGTRGAAFHGALETDRAETIVRKGYRQSVDSYSGVREADRTTVTGLGGYLRDRGVTRALVCGLATDFCVAWTALDCRALGLTVDVVEDACRAIDANGSLAAAWRDMTAAGIGLITSAHA